MGVRLYVSGTDAQIEKFVGATPGVIATAKNLMRAVSEMDERTPEGQQRAFEAYQAAHEEIERIDPNGAYILAEEPFGNAVVRDEAEYGSAKGAAAARVLMRQRARYGAERERLRDLCDRVALACADGRLAGVYWG